MKNPTVRKLQHALFRYAKHVNEESIGLFEFAERTVGELDIAMIGYLHVIRYCKDVSRFLGKIMPLLPDEARSDFAHLSQTFLEHGEAIKGERVTTPMADRVRKNLKKR